MTPETKARVLACRRRAAVAEERGWVRWRLGDTRGAIRQWIIAASATAAARKITKGAVR